MNLGHEYVVERPSENEDFPEELAQVEHVNFNLEIANANSSENFYLTGIRISAIYEKINFDGEVSVRPIQEELEGKILFELFFILLILRFFCY